MPVSTMSNSLNTLDAYLKRALAPIEEMIPLLETEEDPLPVVVAIQQKSLWLANEINRLVRHCIDQSLDEMLVKVMRQRAYEMMVDLTKTVDEAHNIGHLERIEKYAGLLAKLHISDHQSEYPKYHPEKYGDDVGKAAVLHDIGKVCLPRLITNSHKIYDENSPERRILELHAQCGSKILHLSDYLKRGDKRTRIPLAYAIAGEHHLPEYGFKPRKLSLAAQIVKIVDIFDAGTSDRLYKRALPFEEVVNQWIINSRKIQFDPLVKETFYHHRGKIKELYRKLQGEG